MSLLSSDEPHVLSLVPDQITSAVPAQGTRALAPGKTVVFVNPKTAQTIKNKPKTDAKLDIDRLDRLK